MQRIERQATAGVMQREPSGEAGPQSLDRPFGVGERAQQAPGRALPPAAQIGEAGLGGARQFGRAASGEPVWREAGPCHAAVASGFAQVQGRAMGVGVLFGAQEALEVRIDRHPRTVSKIQYDSKDSVVLLAIRPRHE
jgi:hypothetical protein